MDVWSLRYDGEGGLDCVYIFWVVKRTGRV